MTKMAIFEDRKRFNCYLIETEEDWYRACLKQFQKNDNWDMYLEPGDKPEEPEKPGEDASEYSQVMYENKMEEYERDLKRWQEEKRDWDLAERARDGDFTAARRLIEQRDGREYENYRFEHVTTPDDMNDIPIYKVAPRKQVQRMAELLDEIADDPTDINFEYLREEYNNLIEQGDERVIDLGDDDEPLEYGSQERNWLKARIKRILRSQEEYEKARKSDNNDPVEVIERELEILDGMRDDVDALKAEEE